MAADSDIPAMGQWK